MSVGDRYIGEQLRPTDIVGLIDSDTGNIDAALMPTLSGQSYVSANQVDRLAGTHTGGTVVGGFVVGDVVYQLDTEAYWLVASLPSSVAGNWAPWSVFASSQDTGGGVGNAGKLLALDASGKADGRDLATDGTKLDGIAAGAAALTSSTPAALGVAAVGVATTAARGDHVHAMPSAADVGADPAGTTATHAALTTAHGSTALNTASAIVQRDASGNFAAGTITASLTGTASGNDVVGAAAAVQSNLTTHINNATGAHAASAIAVTPSGNLAATTVAAALTEHQGDIDTINSTIASLPVSQGGSGGTSGAPATIDGVANAGGDINLIQGTAIVITPDNGVAKAITIGVDATATPTASKVPIADGSGKLAAGWGGNASTLATLDSSAKVVQDPANATTTAATAKIPIALTGGQLKAEWTATGDPTSGRVPVAAGPGVAPAWTEVLPVSSGGTGSSTGTGGITSWSTSSVDATVAANTGVAFSTGTYALVAKLPTSTAGTSYGLMKTSASNKIFVYANYGTYVHGVAGHLFPIALSAYDQANMQYIDAGTIGLSTGFGSRVVVPACPVPGPVVVILPNATWVQSGGTISSMKDHSGNGYNGTQGTGANQPAYAATGLNSGPSADYNGTTSYIEFATGPLNSAGAFWVAFNFIADTVDANIRILIGKDSRITGPHRHFHINYSTANLTFTVFDNAAGGNIARNATAPTAGVRYTCIATYDGATTLRLYRDGVEGGSQIVTGTMNGVTDFSEPLRIGAAYGSGALDRFHDGDIGTILIGSTLPSAGEIALIHASLAAI